MTDDSGWLEQRRYYLHRFTVIKNHMLEENIIHLPITLSLGSFYNNSFSSYEALSQEGNYHEHKSAHTLQFPCSSFRAIYDMLSIKHL